MWLSKQVLQVRRLIRDVAPAVAVAGGDEARCCVLAEQREASGVQIIAERHTTLVRRIGQRAIGTEFDVREADAVFRTVTRATYKRVNYVCTSTLLS
jgi:hypothetical protein